jgi:hypothetical protein
LVVHAGVVALSTATKVERESDDSGRVAAAEMGEEMSSLKGLAAVEWGWI